MLVTPYEALEDVGYTWQSWGGTWGAAADPIHFELPGASHRHQHRNIALVADLVLGLVPGISEVELGATLMQFGFPHSEVLRFLSSPIETVIAPQGDAIAKPDPLSFFLDPVSTTLTGLASVYFGYGAKLRAAQEAAKLPGGAPWHVGLGLTRRHGQV